MKSIGMAVWIVALSGSLMAQTPQRDRRLGRNLAEMDTNGDGRISKDEWKGPAEAFSRLDSNQDGFITQEEMRQGRQRRGAAARRGGNLRQLDTNHDGKISSEEWKGTQEMFNRIDQDHDGFITQEDLRANRQAPGARGNAVKNLSQMDTDNDGKISRDEWKGPAQMFDRADANGDGFITSDEMRSARQRR